MDSPIWRPFPTRRRGYTLLEMLTTVAALVILLGLMVSLARSVRSASAQELTKDLLRRLDTLTDQYEARRNQLPQVASLLPPGDAPLNEGELRRNVNANNRQLIAALRADAGLGEDSFVGLPERVYDDAVLRD